MIDPIPIIDNNSQSFEKFVLSIFIKDESTIVAAGIMLTLKLHLLLV